MIFAAGLGTRLKPFTAHHPKALAEVNQKPLLQRNIEYLKSYGIREFVINIHHFPDQIRDFLARHQNFGCRISLSDETEALLETGGGLKKAAPLLRGPEPFIVMNADILTNLNLDRMIEFHRSGKPLTSLAVTDRTTSRYFLFNQQHELCGWQNRKSGEQKIVRAEAGLMAKAFSGIHIIEPVIFDLIHREGKFSIVDVYLALCADHKISGYDHSSDILIDVGRSEAIAEAERLFP